MREDTAADQYWTRRVLIVTLRRPRLFQCSRSTFTVYYEEAQSRIGDTCSMYGRSERNSSSYKALQPI